MFKKINMRKILILSLLIISAFVNAQVKFFIETTGNISLISNSQATHTYEVTSEQPNTKKFQKEKYFAGYNNKVGGGVTAGLNYFFKENFSFDAGLGFNNINFHQKTATSVSNVYIPTNSNSEPTETTSVTTTKSDDNHSLFLLSLPVSLSYYLLENTLSMGVGLIPSLLIYDSGGIGSATDFNKVHLGIQLQLSYEFIPQWWLTAGFQEYSTKLYDPELKTSFSNLRLLKMGLKYDF